jgi:NAD(P)-dependent dehydrogenase (short-subunit alcohol dehydrogenase family)
VGHALAGRVAIVTGASRGIGKGCALELAAAGATVYLTGRTVREGAAALPGTVGGTASEIATTRLSRRCSRASTVSRAASTCS